MLNFDFNMEILILASQGVMNSRSSPLGCCENICDPDHIRVIASDLSEKRSKY
jgi:hypothetical protein